MSAEPLLKCCWMDGEQRLELARLGLKLILPTLPPIMPVITLIEMLLDRNHEADLVLA
jgi:hypothetical protein